MDRRGLTLSEDGSQCSHFNALTPRFSNCTMAKQTAAAEPTPTQNNSNGLMYPWRPRNFKTPTASEFTEKCIGNTTMLNSLRSFAQSCSIYTDFTNINIGT